MEIGWLKEFLVLSRTLNYRASAEALFISQSTLSKHINAMEQELGVTLFLRDTKSVRLTEEGRVFRDSANLIVNEYDVVAERFSGVHVVSGILRIGAAVRYPPVSKYLNPAVLAFEEKYPNVDILIEDIQWRDYRERLLKGDLDIVISICPPSMIEDGLVVFDLDAATMCIWADAENKLVQQSSVTLAELSGQKLRILEPDKSRAYVSFVRGMFDNAGLPIKMGKPMTQVFSMDDTSFCLTPSFPPADHFGSSIVSCELQDSPTIRIVAARKRSISNPLAALFFEEMKNMQCS